MTQDEKKLNEAVAVLRAYCASHVHLTDCLDFVFYNWHNGCQLDGVPSTWEDTAPRRFNAADVALAKALKAFGCKIIRKPSHADYCCSYIEVPGRDTEVISLPTAAFTSISKGGRSVSINDIIKEGEPHDDLHHGDDGSA